MEKEKMQMEIVELAEGFFSCVKAVEGEVVAFDRTGIWVFEISDSSELEEKLATMQNAIHVVKVREYNSTDDLKLAVMQMIERSAETLEEEKVEELSGQFNCELEREEDEEEESGLMLSINYCKRTQMIALAMTCLGFVAIFLGKIWWLPAPLFVVGMILSYKVLKVRDTIVSNVVLGLGVTGCIITLLNLITNLELVERLIHWHF